MHEIFSHSFFFFNDTATTEIYTLSLHDALPICTTALLFSTAPANSQESNPRAVAGTSAARNWPEPTLSRSEEHTSELQSLTHLVCRLLLVKKKKKMAPVRAPTTT